MNFSDVVKSPIVPYDTFEEGNAIYPEDAADSPATANRTPLGVIRAMREVQLADAYWRFGIQRLSVRFYDPIRLPELGRMLRHVAFEIWSIVVRHDRCQAKDAQRITAELRRVCKPLGPRKLIAKRGDILLTYGQRTYCLLRYHSDYPSRRVSRRSGRAIGCKFTILSETSEALLKEIAYYQTRASRHSPSEDFQNIVPSAKRFTRPNAFLRAPEDGRSVVDCMAGSRLVFRRKVR
jgi:hypothetical protein